VPAEEKNPVRPINFLWFHHLRWLQPAAHGRGAWNPIPLKHQRKSGDQFSGTRFVNDVLGDKIIYTDPISSEADYANLPKADMILITHGHYDHLDLKAVVILKPPPPVSSAPRKWDKKFRESLSCKTAIPRPSTHKN